MTSVLKLKHKWNSEPLQTSNSCRWPLVPVSFKKKKKTTAFDGDESWQNVDLIFILPSSVWLFADVKLAPFFKLSFLLMS